MDTNHIIAPILMQRKCDGGQDKMSKEDWAALVARRLQGEQVGFMGCGTVFQWWWGSGCVCPGCGRTLSVTFGDLHTYRVQSHPLIDEREMVDKVMREVMVRLGNLQ